MSEPLPPCGLYRTLAPIGSVPAGKLVYFHDHGQPGPGVYMPEKWRHNRAVFRSQGTPLPSADDARSLAPLHAEGLYRVVESFTCCEKRCRTFATDQLVQLGYDGDANPIIFVPEWTSAGLGFPELGQKIEEERLSRMAILQVARSQGHEGPLAS